jgi:hypothetical protein
MIPFMEAQRKKEQAEAEENRKKMLEEKKKQLPELEIVKIGTDDNVEEVPLRIAKRKAEQQQTQFQNKRWRKDDKKREPEVPNGNNAAEMDIESKLKEVATVVENMKNKNKKFNKKGKPQKPSDFRQNSNKPVPFDYSKVTYERFQGGSSNGPNSSQKDQKSNQKFKGGKKSKGNIDKMFNFSNFRLNKK